MKGFKILGIAVAILLALMLLAGVLVSVFFDPNDYRDDIGRLVGERTGRELSIDGDLELSIFPWLAVEVGAVRLSNAPGFGDQPFAEIKSARAGIRLLPLFSNQVQVSELKLEGLRLHLARNQAGASNWDDLSGGRDSAPAKPPVPEAADEGSMASLEIGGIAIRDAAISLVDQQAGQRLELTEFELSTGPVVPGKPVELDAGFRLDLADQQSMLANLKGRISSAQDFSELTGEKLELGMTLKGPGLPEQGLKVDSGIESFLLNLDSGALEVKGMLVEALGARISMALTGQTVLSDTPSVKGRLSMPSMSPRDALKQLGSSIETTDPAALGAFALAGDFQYDGKSAGIRGLEARLDDTSVTGQFGISDLQKQSLRFDLQLDRIDLDRYLPPESDEPAAAPAEPGADEEIDLKALRELDAEGQLRIGEVTVAGLSFTNAVVSVKAANGKLRLHPLKTAFYGGQYEGDVVLDARGDTPTLSLDERIAGVQIAPVMKVLSDYEILSGSAGGVVKLSASGSSVKGMLSSLSGNLDLAVVEGALEGVDLVYELQRAEALFNRQAPAPAAGPRRTPFQSMKMSAKVDQGTLRSDDLDIAMPVLKITGAGGMSLVEQSVDYQLQARIHEVPPAGAVDLGQLRGATIPLRISGTFSDPKVSADVAGLVTERAKKELDEKLDEEKDKLADKLKKKLFGN